MSNVSPHRPHIQMMPFVLTLAAALAVVKLFGGTTIMPHLSTASASSSASPFFNITPSSSAAQSGLPSPSQENPAESETEITSVERPSTEEGFVSDEETRVLARLRDRRERLNRREEALNTAEILLRTTQSQIETALAQLEAREAALAVREAQVAQDAAEDITNIVKAYERMKPRDAARIFDLLDDDLLVSVAHQMRAQALASILADMTPDRARELTTLLAERRALLVQQTPGRQSALGGL